MINEAKNKNHPVYDYTAPDDQLINIKQPRSDRESCTM